MSKSANLAGTDVKSLYDTNKDISDYVNAYCQHRGVTVAEALSHITVRAAIEYYIDSRKDLLTDAEKAPGDNSRIGGCDALR